jgi:hypothetical protein
LIWRDIYAIVGAVLLGAYPSFAEWSAETGTSVSYTTNLFQFASASRLALEQHPSQLIVVRDILSKPSDVIWQPSVRVARSWSSRLGTSELSFKTEGALYTYNPPFNNADALHLRLGFQQTQQHSTLESRSFHSSTVTYGVRYRF